MLKNIFKDNLKTIRLNTNGFSYLGSLTPLFSIDCPEEELLVVIAHQPPVVVPIELYDPETDVDYLKVQYDVSQLEEVVASEFKDYSLLNFITHDQKRKLETVDKPIHFIPLFLFQVLHIPQIPEKTILIDLQNDTLQISLLMYEELQFITYFNLVGEMDGLYHLINICTQYEIPREEAELFYTHITPSMEKLLKPYFKLNSLLKK